jgi:hypothetical protein
MTPSKAFSTEIGQLTSNLQDVASKVTNALIKEILPETQKRISDSRDFQPLFINPYIKEHLVLLETINLLNAIQAPHHGTDSLDYRKPVARADALVTLLEMHEKTNSQNNYDGVIKTVFEYGGEASVTNFITAHRQEMIDWAQSIIQEKVPSDLPSAWCSLGQRLKDVVCTASAKGLGR